MCKIADWIVWILLVVCGVSDWKKREIPTLWLSVMSIMVGGWILCFGRNMVISRVLGGLLGIFFFMISKYTKEAVGYGDSWLILILGIYLGGLKALRVLFLASLMAGVIALLSLWKKKWKKSVSIPFVPFLVVAYLGVICL